MSPPTHENMTDKTPRTDDMSIKEKSIVNPETTEMDLKAGEVIEDLDAAEVFLRDNNFSHSYLHELLQDEAACKKLVRKVNWTLMPLLCGTYLLQYIDKQALSYAAVFDLFKSTKTTSDEYAWLTSIFYFGYLVSEWPSSYLAQHFPTGKVLSYFVITWGSVFVWKLPRHNSNGLLVSYYLIGSFVASLVLALQMPANNVAGYTKRVTATAFVFLAYCIGNICGPHAFLADEAPTYETGCKFIIACAAIQVVLVFALRALLVHRNKKRDAEFGLVSDMDTSEETIEDLTDFENPRFRYSY